MLKKLSQKIKHIFNKILKNKLMKNTILFWIFCFIFSIINQKYNLHFNYILFLIPTLVFLALLNNNDY